MGRATRRLALSAALLGMMTGRTEATFITLDPTSGLQRGIRGLEAPIPVVTYTPTRSGFYVHFQGRPPATEVDDIAKFAVPAPPAGESITGAFLGFTVPFAVGITGASRLSLRVGIFGSGGTSTSPSDFGVAPAETLDLFLHALPPPPQFFSLDVSSSFQSLARGSPAVGFRFEAGVPETLEVSDLHLVVVTGAVPGPASLVMVVMAVVGGAGAWLGRRARA